MKINEYNNTYFNNTQNKINKDLEKIANPTTVEKNMNAFIQDVYENDINTSLQEINNFNDAIGFMQIADSALKNISENLNHNFTMKIEREILPYNTVEAISYGGIGMIISLIENIAKKEKIYFTGGDGIYLSKFFNNTIYIKDLIFRGMKETIKENNL